MHISIAHILHVRMWFSIVWSAVIWCRERCSHRRVCLPSIITPLAGDKQSTRTHAWGHSVRVSLCTCSGVFSDFQQHFSMCAHGTHPDRVRFICICICHQLLVSDVRTTWLQLEAIAYHRHNGPFAEQMAESMASLFRFISAFGWTSNYSETLTQRYAVFSWVPVLMDPQIFS